MSESLAKKAPPITVYRCPRCDHEQETEQEPERCPVCSFHGLPDGRWIMELVN
jgi:rubrerythrin